MRAPRPIHPFPARMAPDVALAALQRLEGSSIVLDPMSGSGTVIRQATELGLRAIGYDMDPLAVLMSEVWTTPVCDEAVARACDEAIAVAKAARGGKIRLPWLDGQVEAQRYVEYWFGEKQCADLRRLAHALFVLGESRGTSGAAAVNVLRLALSRIIITKERGASRARDTSHSRPHRAYSDSEFDVLSAFQRSVRFVRGRLADEPPRPNATVGIGDARSLPEIQDNSIDCVLTSPPYLNAIDYLRGHRLALIWLGYGLEEIRCIRSKSVGAERGLDRNDLRPEIELIVRETVRSDSLRRRYRRMIERYVWDLHLVTKEMSRVLAPKGTASFVIGNSCLRGAFVRNSFALERVAEMSGMILQSKRERELPRNRRYLPVAGNPKLEKRMTTESICVFSLDKECRDRITRSVRNSTNHGSEP